MPHDQTSMFGESCTFEDAAIVLVPVPFDATCSYRTGAAGAPAAILEASPQIDLDDRRFGNISTRGIVMEPAHPEVEALAHEGRSAAAVSRSTASSAAAGRVDRACEAMVEHARERTRAILEAGKTPGIVGGEHGVSLGAIRAAASCAAGMGVLQIDAHMDLRRSYEGFRYSHASVIRNAIESVSPIGPIVQVGVRDFAAEEADFAKGRDITTYFWDDIADDAHRGTPWRTMAERFIRPLPRDIYLTVDIDGLDPSLCPHTGTPVPGGLNWDHISILLEELARSDRRIVAFDLVEVSPGSGDASQLDAIIAARLLYRLCAVAGEPSARRVNPRR